MIPNFLVFSFLHILKSLKLRQAGAIKTGNWDPQIIWDGHEVTLNRPLAPSVVDAAGEMGKLMELKCAQPSNTNMVGNAQGES